MAERHSVATQLCCMGHTATADRIVGEYGDVYTSFEKRFSELLLLLHKAKRRSEYRECKVLLYRFDRHIMQEIPEALSCTTNVERAEIHARRTLWEKKYAAERASAIIQSTLYTKISASKILEERYRRFVCKKKLLSKTYTLRTFNEITHSHNAYDELLRESTHIQDALIHTQYQP